MPRNGPWTAWAAAWRAAIRASADSLAASGVARPLDRMKAEPNRGPTVVARELKAWARVRRLCDVAGFPALAARGLAAT